MLNDGPIRLSPTRLMPVLAVSALCLASVRLSATEPPSPGTPRITYTKILKGSVPEYLSITVDRQGEALFEGRRLDEPSTPRAMKLRAETTQKIFELAANLGNFSSGDLESYRKVANLGRKTFIYDDGKQKYQAEFNYSQRHEAQELVETFERISNVGQHIAALEHLIQFDPLNLPQQLRRIQIDLAQHSLESPEILSPTLEKIARNPRFLHLAQSRAQEILGHLQTHP
jgi:hypothetical protein